ncbi:hypothetical protein KVR01_010398 [Diaporthe batatas]|uniref:uncharacterized protein n=1 Tax=Diaporthe batatas TaxID=748121 RepID=UPI001D046D3A|nr:uncharacterized protein KVR01_010398 [Diaporthe batatas]KAG8159761.1 hypothetical protein KVR01_010398 [Diaporthe batatas]
MTLRNRAAASFRACGGCLWETRALAALASDRQHRSTKWATFQGLVLVDPGPKRSGSSPTTVLVTSPAQALIPTDRRCRARPWLGRDGSQIDSALLALSSLR